ncbi:hypothetical protein PN450_16800 [Dolichospermum lemmermannii CS-548]|nr:hypothetical protein [Dolichospermum lemmermannii CS-548]
MMKITEYHFSNILLDFISTWGENYAKAPRTRKQLREFKSLTQSVLDKVDDLDIQEEWKE